MNLLSSSNVNQCVTIVVLDLDPPLMSLTSLLVVCLDGGFKSSLNYRLNYVGRSSFTEVSTLGLKITSMDPSRLTCCVNGINTNHLVS